MQPEPPREARPPRRLDRISDDDYSEIPSPARDPTRNDSEDSDSGNVNIKVLAYQGGQRTQAWLASVQARMPNALSKLLDANREAQTPIDEVRIPKAVRDVDQSLFAALVESLIDTKASPANEGLAIFNKLNASQSTIGRSGVRAILAVENITYGNTSESKNAAMQELMAINVRGTAWME